MCVERLVMSTRIHKLLKSPFRFSSQGSRVGALVTLLAAFVHIDVDCQGTFLSCFVHSAKGHGCLESLV